jgi:hypothetical protein
MGDTLDPAAITALAALGGSLVGGLASFATTWLTQRQRSHNERVSLELDKRELIYVRFNELGMALILDSLDHELDDPAKLAELVVLTGRIRLTSSKPVLDAAQHVIAELIRSYQQPRRDRRDILTKPDEYIRPLVNFTEAARLEREAMLRGI